MANPSSIVAVAAPTILSIVELFFLINDSGPYNKALIDPNVCALLEHRTQLYTLVVAYFFFTLQFSNMVHRQIVTRNGSWEWKRAKDHSHLGHCTALFAALTISLGYLFLSGRMMTTTGLDAYRSLKSCTHHQIYAVELPPLDAWVTICRFLVAIIAFSVTLLDRRHVSKSAAGAV